jgi:hypothetical protein
VLQGEDISLFCERSKREEENPRDVTSTVEVGSGVRRGGKENHRFADAKHDPSCEDESGKVRSARTGEN